MAASVAATARGAGALRAARRRRSWSETLCATTQSAALLIFVCFAIADDTAAQQPFRPPARMRRLPPVDGSPQQLHSAAAAPTAPPGGTARTEELVDLEARIAALEQRWRAASAEAAVVGHVEPSKPPVNLAPSPLAPTTIEEREGGRTTRPKITGKIRGRLEPDLGFFHQSPLNIETIGDLQDGVDFRRARMGMEGDVWEQGKYIIEMDFAQGQVNFTDVYWALVDLPLLREFRIGHFREPFSLEAQTSSNFFTFMERSTANTFDPARNWGIGSFRYSENERSTLAFGGFRTAANGAGDDVGDPGEWAFTMRGTWLPWWDSVNEGRGLWHVGASYSARDAEGNIVQFGTTPEGRLNSVDEVRFPPIVETPRIPAHGYQLAGIESVIVNGPLSVQAEWINAFVDPLSGGPIYLNGAYAFVSWFITGEQRVYDRKRGKFAGRVVYRPFFSRRDCGVRRCGPGAWEVALRYSYLSLASPNMPTFPDGELGGGTLSDMTVGVNWYFNDYMRLMWNYIYAVLDNPNTGTSDANLFLMRAAVYW